MKLVFALVVFAIPVLSQESDREKSLMDRIDQLEKRISELEKRVAQGSVSVPEAPVKAALEQPPVSTVTAPAAAPPAGQAATSNPATPSASDLLRGTTINLFLDLYYGYNFNDPIGRANLLRAYDVSSNSFSLNQADVVVENAPDPGTGKRLGARLDLQFGQATQTLQGSSTNEPRPDIYRNIFQAYGTYVFPVANNGLTVDFGKWASSLGLEGNYSKDQINYSRSFWFTFLPFYHMGVRAAFKLSDAISANYWVVNGTNQTEAFNGFKDELFGLVITPHKNVNWTLNYYLGQEHPDVVFYPNGGAPTGSPTIQGVPFQSIVNPPTGHLNIFDSYVTWQASPKAVFAGEADYVLNRLNPTSSPTRTWGGAAYAQYRFTQKFAAGSRAEYLADRGGAFSGVSQAIKETTLTVDYSLANGFLMRAEFRRDFSNQPYFYTNMLDVLKKEQNTATMGVIWWFGAKQGTW